MSPLYVVSCAGSNTGSATARHLLAAKAPVRVVVRSEAKAQEWRNLGAEAIVADVKDAEALAKAYEGATAVYIMNPPAYTAVDPIAEAQKVADVAITALQMAPTVSKVVLLSSVASHLSEGTGLIKSTYILEQAFQATLLNVGVLRPCWFMENWAGPIAGAVVTGKLNSFVVDLDKPFAQVATEDIGAAAAKLLMSAFTGRKVVELQGPKLSSPKDVAAAITTATGKAVEAVAVPAEQVPSVVANFGFSPSVANAYIEMVAGINSGHIAFEGGAVEQWSGKVPIDHFVLDHLGKLA